MTLIEILDRVHFKLTGQGAVSEPANKPFDFAALKRLTDGLPVQKQSAADFIREMRNEKY